MTAAHQYQSLRQLLARELKQIKAACRDAMKPEIIARVALSTVNKCPDLLKCTPESFLAAVVQSAQLGLEPDNVSGLAYLVPYGRTCTLIVGYRGMIQLAYRSNQVKSIEGRAVYGNDAYDIDWGRTPPITHRPTSNEERGELAAVYAIVHLTTGGVTHYWMWRHEVDAIRGRSAAAQARSSPWHTDYEAMAIKTVIRRACKYIPSSPTLQRAVALGEKTESLRDDNAGMLDAEFRVKDASADISAGGAPAPKAAPEPSAPPVGNTTNVPPPDPSLEPAPKADEQIGESDLYQRIAEAYTLIPAGAARAAVRELLGLKLITDCKRMTSVEANDALIVIKAAGKAVAETGGTEPEPCVETRKP